MLRHHLIIAWRQLRKSPLHSVINIIGLATGMAVALLIGLWMKDELSFDHYHRNHDRLTEVLSVGFYNGTVTAGPHSSVPLADELLRRYPDDLTAVALISEGGQVLTSGDIKTGQWGWYAQPELPKMFTLQLLKGSRDALNDPSAILLSRSLAKIFFGDADPMNRTILAGPTNRAVKVAGVYEDLPENTTLSPVKFLLSWSNPNNPGLQEPDDWSNHHFQLFVQLGEKVSLDAVNVRIKDIAKPHAKKGYEEIRLHPMDRWHLYDRSENGKMIAGRLQSVRLFGTIGGFVLLLACINFMNLSTAKSIKRARETGVRKAIGSLRSQLIGQFLCESMLVTFIALVLAIVLAQLSMSLFNNLSDKHLSIPYASPWFWMVLLCFTFFTGFVSGSYPAFYLSGFRAANVLKGTFQTGSMASSARKALVTLQFTISIALIIGTIIVLRQIQYAMDRPVGYTPAGLLAVQPDMAHLLEQQEGLRYALLQTGAVESMGLSSSATTNVQNSMFGYDWEGRDPLNVPVIGTLFVSYDFGKAIGWHIKEGRDFSRDFPSDSGAYILNEAAVRYTGLKDPVGKSIRWHGIAHPIVGVISDMVMESPYQPAEPTFFTLQANQRISYVLIRIRPSMAIPDALKKIEPVFRQFNPEGLFYYTFADVVYHRKFQEEQHIANLASIFALFAIFISCLGLFGLAAFVAEQRTKEIGIRKILGATVFDLWRLLTTEFVLLVMLSFLIAAPLAAYGLHRWLGQYAYHTPIAWWIFAAAGSGALVITLLTVSAQAIRAARMNPVKSLKI